jgi:hypothetical protein
MNTSGRIENRLVSLAVSAFTACVVVAACSVVIRAQDASVKRELSEKVADLVKRLDAPKAAARQEAQAELIKLGAEALPLLPSDDTDELSAEQRRRLTEVRTALAGSGAKAVVAGSKLNLVAKGITLSDVVAEIQKQTGNQLVDLREEFGQDVTNTEFMVDWKDKGFWEAMDELSAKSGVSYYLHTGERQLGLVAQPLPATPVAYAGPLRIAFTQIVRRVQFETNQKECLLQFEIAWEPRLQPILFEMKRDQTQVIDDQDRKIEVQGGGMAEAPEEETSTLKAAVDGSMVRTDFIVHMAQPAKGAEKLRVAGVLNIVLPADIQTFDFAELGKSKNVKKEKGKVAVTLEQFAVLDEGLWGADLVLEFGSGGEAFESYETWFYDNEAYLQRADGTRFSMNGGVTLTESGDGKLGIQYRFVDAPGKLAEYKLVYKTPSAIVQEAIPFEFKDIELP